MNPLPIVRTKLRLAGAVGLAVLAWIGLEPTRLEAASRDNANATAMRLFKAECFSCHNPERKKGGLVLTSRERLLEGGDTGVVVVPGKPDGSLFTKVLANEADPHMPPKKQLADAQIKVIRDWIKGGAGWNQAALDEEEAITPVNLAALPSSYRPVLALALSPDGGRLAVGRGGLLVIHEASQTNFPVLAEIEANVVSILRTRSAERFAALAPPPGGRVGFGVHGEGGQFPNT